MPNFDQQMEGICFAFPPDVFLVEGIKRHCLYDLCNGDLYNISNKAKSLIVSLIQKTCDLVTLSSEEKELVTGLIDNQLLVYSSEEKSPQNILSLAQSFPLEFAWIEVTKACNLKCKFCYEESHPFRDEKMSLEDFQYVIDELQENGINAIQLIGGEPFMLGNVLKEMLKVASGKFSHLEVFTNGTFIDDAWCEFLKAHNVIVSLSVHSYVPEEHDQVTQVKGFHHRIDS